MATNYEDPSYLYFQNIETGNEVAIVHAFYAEPDTNYFEETLTCDELGEEWYSEADMEKWMKDNGYTDEY